MTTTDGDYRFPASINDASCEFLATWHFEVLLQPSHNRTPAPASMTYTATEAPIIGMAVSYTWQPYDGSRLLRITVGDTEAHTLVPNAGHLLHPGFDDLVNTWMQVMHKYT